MLCCTNVALLCEGCVVASFSFLGEAVWVLGAFVCFHLGIPMCARRLFVGTYVVAECDEKHCIACVCVAGFWIFESRVWPRMFWLQRA